MNVVTKKQILEILKTIDPTQILESIEQGFILYSKDQVVVPPVGHLGFDSPRADTHIKYGYIKDDNYYVVKIASSFYENPAIGLPSSNGLMLVFNKTNGILESILLDEGYLTDIRTAIAGAIVAKYFAPKNVSAIGIIGTGTQARFQLHYLKNVIQCRKVYVWSRNINNAHDYAKEMSAYGFEVNAVEKISDITKQCNLIVTTTPSTTLANDIQAGTHITAMGADAIGKQELDPKIFSKVDISIVDSKTQCVEYGDTSYAIKEGLITQDKIIEIGTVIDKGLHRANESQITVADLTGVAVQDIQIAKFIHNNIDKISK